MHIAVFRQRVFAGTWNDNYPHVARVAAMAEPNPDDYPTFTADQLVIFRESFATKDVQNHGYIPKMALTLS